MTAPSAALTCHAASSVWEDRRVIDPLERWRRYGEKPDFAGLLTYGGQPYTEDPSELAGADVAIVKTWLASTSLPKKLSACR